MLYVIFYLINNYESIFNDELSPNDWSALKILNPTVVVF